jgi:hypothetical protein
VVAPNRFLVVDYLATRVVGWDVDEAGVSLVVDAVVAIHHFCACRG